MIKASMFKDVRELPNGMVEIKDCDPLANDEEQAELEKTKRIMTTQQLERLMKLQPRVFFTFESGNDLKTTGN